MTDFEFFFEFEESSSALRDVLESVSLDSPSPPRTPKKVCRKKRKRRKKKEKRKWTVTKTSVALGSHILAFSCLLKIK